MPKRSAGILMYRRRGDGIEVLLVHPGGPLWAGKDEGAWSVPKGEYAEGEDPLTVARREFEEETSFPVDGEFHPLGEVRQRAGKVVTIFAVEGDCDASAIRSNHFTMEWPPRSGNMASFPEVDRAEWLTPGAARVKMNPGQLAALDRLLAMAD